MTDKYPSLGQSVDEKLFRLLVANVNDYAIFMIDPNGYIMSWNKGAEHIKGYKEAEIVGEHISVFYTREDVKNNIPRSNLNEALKKGTHTYEGWRVKKDNTVFWASVTFTTIYNDDGHLVGFAKITRDITENKALDDKKTKKTDELERRLHVNTARIIANELRFRKLIENSYDGLTLLDEEFRILYRSFSSERINGWNAIERAQYTHIALTHPDDQQRIKELIAEVLSKPYVPILTTYRTRHKLGHYIWLECVYTNMLSDVNINAIVCNFRDITEKKLAEIKLAENEQRFRELLENSTDVVVVTAFDGSITYISPNAKKTLGYDIKKLSLEQRADMMHPDDREPYRELFLQVRDSPGKIYPFTYRIKNAEGNYLWIEGTVTNLLNVPGVNGLVTNSRDVTDRKNKEQQIEAGHVQLRQAAETQASILNALPSHIVLLNEKSKIIAVNQSWKNLALANNLGVPNFGIGYSYLALAEKTTGLNKADTINLEKGIKDVISRNKKGFSLEYLSNLPGEKKWYLVVVAPLVDHLHKGAVVSHLDITDRKQAQESHLKSEDNLRSVFENTDLSIVLFDADLKIASFNNNAKGLSIRNYRKKLKVGNPAFNYFSKQRKGVIQQILDRVKQSEIVSYESSFELADGRIEWYDVKWVGVTDKQLQTVGYIMTLKDITGKKRADMEREQITADLLKRNNVLEQYAYIVSHNLRAPVANIMGLSNLLSAIESTDLTAREILDALSTSINNLDQVIVDLNQILQVSSQVNNANEQVSLSALVDDIKTGNREIVVTNNASIICHFEALGKIKTIKGYLYSVFQSLIINGIKYRRPDADPIINIRSEVTGNKALIRFRDNGKGIDMAKNGPHLFDLYKRFDDDVDGRGTGLFMVKMQIENLGGSITVQSALNKGSQFVIELPIN